MTKHEASAPRACPTTCPTATARWRCWLDPRLFRAGAGSGLLGGLCRIARAIAVGSGLGLGLASRLMDRYQPYLIAASLLMMA
jgi:hypothetical protein